MKLREPAAAAEPSSDEEQDGEVDDETIAAVHGPCDQQGLPHGRCSVVYASGLRFWGRLVHGVRQGRGVMQFPDGMVIRGVYRDGELNGPAVVAMGGDQDEDEDESGEEDGADHDGDHDNDTGDRTGEFMTAEAPAHVGTGSRLEGTYEDGLLNGPAVERAADGSLLFRGQYRDNVRCGRCSFYMPDGGEYHGLVDETSGALSDAAAVYLYPPAGDAGKDHEQRHALIGCWRDGQMVRAVHRFPYAPADARPVAETTTDTVYTCDESTETCASATPLVEDPFEACQVTVAGSTVPGAGEGLFARCALPAGVVCSLYSGVRVQQAEVDLRDWDRCHNTISLDSQDIVIDVPPHLNDTAVYCATLGHKANHSFTPNAKYDSFSHPRFGDIKCVRTLTPVAAGDEIFCCYDYELGAELNEMLREVKKQLQRQGGGPSQGKRKRARLSETGTHVSAEGTLLRLLNEAIDAAAASPAQAQDKGAKKGGPEAPAWYLLALRHWAQQSLAANQ
eukprot:m.68995 g.68995  ORF g.68995 m.68995 type:complete len:506 (+) comp13945_c0_seq2:97-1614(+)